MLFPPAAAQSSASVRGGGRAPVHAHGAERGERPGLRGAAVPVGEEVPGAQVLIPATGDSVRRRKALR